MDGSITIVSTGVSIANSTTSSRVAIPTDSSGSIPGYVRVASTNQMCMRAGNASVTATTNDTLVQNADAIILRTLGMTHIAAISANGGTSGYLQISPLEDR